MKVLMTNETGPIKEKHTLMERIFNQKYILESQGLIFKNQYDLTQYITPPSYEGENWKKINEAMMQFGQRAEDAAKAMSKLVEVWQNENKKSNS